MPASSRHHWQRRHCGNEALVKLFYERKSINGWTNKIKPINKTMVAVEEKDAEANKKTTFQVNTGATEQGNTKNNSPTSVGQIHVWEMDLKESLCSTTSSMTITPSRKSALKCIQETSGRFMETIYKQGKGNHHRKRHFEISEMKVQLQIMIKVWNKCNLE